MRRARRGGTEAPFVISARKKEKKRKGKFTEGTFPTTPSVISHLRFAQLRFATGTLVRRGDLPSVREVLVRPPLPTPRDDLILVRVSVLVQERAPRHRAVPRAPSGRTKIDGSRFCGRRGDPTASPRTFADAPLLARTLPRSDPIPPPSARGVDRCSISCLGGRLRPRASSSRAPRFRRCSDGVLGKRVPSERNLPISARRICARSSLYGRWASRLSFGAGIEPGLIRIATFGITDRLACRQVFLFSFSNQACIPHTRVNVFARSPACQPPSSSKRP